MRMIPKKLTGYIMAGVLAASVSLPMAANASDYYTFDDSKSHVAPSGGEMLADAFMVRPFMLVGSILTTATFIVTLPFSAIGGNTGEAAQTLVAEPLKYTFARPLGEM